ncbi:MAG: hypothetical protein ACPF9D_13175, partial [Owenweeksia sp.]
GLLFFTIRTGIKLHWKWALTGVVFYLVFLTGPINASRFMLAVWPVMVICTMQAFGRGGSRIPVR